MRIGILTFHHVANWGSALQAYALFKLVKSLNPFADVEIIDYIPETSNAYSKSHVRTASKGDTVINVFRRTKKLDYHRKAGLCSDFLRYRTRLSPKRLVSDSLSLGLEYLNDSAYDTILVGSDTVFQLGPNYGSTYISAPQPPNLYCLPFNIEANKIAVSASANPYHPDVLKSLETRQISAALNDFSSIFFRDLATKNALDDLGVKEPVRGYSLDPSLLIDLDHLSESSSDNLSSMDRDLAAVAVGNAELAKGFIESLDASGYTTVNLLSGPERGGEILRKISHYEDFISLHRCFKVVVTDRFHGSIISFLQGVPTVIGIEDSSRYKVQNSKTRDLYERLGLPRNIYRINSDATSMCKQILEHAIAFSPQSYLELRQRMLHLRAETIDLFLKFKVLEG